MQGLQSGGRLSGFTNMSVPGNVAAWSKVRVFMLAVSTGHLALPYHAAPAGTPGCARACAISRSPYVRRGWTGVLQKFADDLGKSELFLAFFVVFGVALALVSVLFVVTPASVRAYTSMHTPSPRTSTHSSWRQCRCWTTLMEATPTTSRGSGK